MSTAAKQQDFKALFKRALVTLDELQTKLDRAEQRQKEPIAIIGIGCRFPGGGNNPDAFWQVLRSGTDTVREIPSERWDADAYYDPRPDVPGKMYTRYAAFLEQVDQFDPHFFGIAPREALSMDPQQRLLAEVAWEALEHAGQANAGLHGSRTGVYIGISGSDYQHLQTKSGDTTVIDTYSGSGNAHSIASGRLSYMFGLQGPSVSVDTACSASLTAVHFACQSLRAEECDMAIAGGINLIIAPDGIVTASQAHMLSPDGRCKTFDESADGYVRGEGCGIIVLKRLSDARASHDNILAVIRSTAANQDGRSGGLTAPNGLAQEAVIREALVKAGVAPGDIDYVETHGTGTSLGDPIEVRSLAAVFGSDRSKDNPLLIGSVKTNVGHLEAAAGIVGLIKVVLAMLHKEIPPHLHFKNANPYIPWQEIPIAVTAKLQPWDGGNQRRLAGLSSFGFSGTNVHAIIEEAPEIERHASEPERPLHLLALSAKSAGALQSLASHYAAAPAIAGVDTSGLADACFTANAGRTHYSHRLAVLAADGEAARAKLAAFAAGNTDPHLLSGVAEGSDMPEIAFLFTGQGAQYAGMSRQLFETQPTFRKAIETCDAILRDHLDRPLLSLLFAEGNDGALLDETAYTQPALFAVEYALATLWCSWGVEPTVVMGHSVGEYVAATVAGLLSLEDGLKLIAARGRLMQSLPKNGMMAAVFASQDRVQLQLSGYHDNVSIAAFNGPENIVISGEKNAVTELLTAFAADGIKHKTLAVSHAFHSPLMAPILDEFEQIAGEVQFQSSQIGVVSNVTGKLEPDSFFADPKYWRRHVREAVNFNDSMKWLYAQGHRFFLEIGPHPTLLGMGMRSIPAAGCAWLPSLRQGKGDWEQMLESLGQLYTRGVAVDWHAFDRDYQRRRVVLPVYPFQRKRYWLKTVEIGARDPYRLARLEIAGDAVHPLLGSRLASPLAAIQFQARISLEKQGFLRDHRFYDNPVFPATGYVEMALAAAKQRWPHQMVHISAFAIHEPLLLEEEAPATLQCVLTPDGADSAAFQVYSLQTGAENGVQAWRLHAAGKLSPASETADGTAPSLIEVQKRCQSAYATRDFYQEFQALGVTYGAAFQGIQQLSHAGGEALGDIVLPETVRTAAADYHFHPALLDACLQLFGAALLTTRDENGDDAVYMPTGFERLQMSGEPGERIFAHVALQKSDRQDNATLSGDVSVWTPDGELVARIEHMHFRRIRRELLMQSSGNYLQELLYDIAWEPMTEPVPADPPAAGHWLILADADGLGSAVAGALREQDIPCTLAFAGETTAAQEPATWTIDPADPEGMVRLLASLPAGKDTTVAVLYLWALDAELPERAVTGALLPLQQRVSGGLLHLAQALLRGKIDLAGLWVVTQGAQSVDGEAPAIAQAPLWGLTNVLRQEAPGLRCTSIDLDPEVADRAAAAASLQALLALPAIEARLAVRSEQHYRARLARLRPGESSPSPAAEQPVHLVIGKRGTLENLELRPQQRREPDSHEVMVRVRATGLNFRDVLNTLGMYPGDAGDLGHECAGEVVAVGSAVSGLQAGDRVIALAGDSFATYVTTSAEFVLPLPNDLDFVDAATLPITYLTAWFALHHLGKMRKGERVLIHAAAGGVGLAAVQLALNAGAEIYATAGSPRKHEFLKNLGVTHIFNSRTLDFAGEIMEATGGEGIDIVLNSLAGDFIPKSLELLRENGRFLEIGKTDLWDEDRVKAVNPKAAYDIIYLGETILEDPPLIRRLFEEIIAALQAGRIKPLPAKSFPLQRAAEAFRYMAQAKHIGKVVVTQDGAAPQTTSPAAPAGATIRGDATYLITGGLGAIGLHVARWLVDAGARTLALVGRREPDDAAQQVLDELTQAGAAVHAIAADIAREEEVERLLQQIDDTGLPALRGIFHAAGVLADSVIAQQEWSHFEQVMLPKVRGTWLLHEKTAHLPIEQFVLFSSIASAFGSMAQANYAAANAFMDAFAHFRRAHGLPAASINWGPWDDGGMVTALGERGAERRATQGIGLITPAQGVQALAAILRHGAPQATVLPIDWTAFFRQFAPETVPALFAGIYAQHAQRDAGAAAAPAVDLRQQLQEATPAERQELLLDHVRAQVVTVLGLDPEQPPSLAQGLTDIGMDSLMAVELSNRLQASLGISLPSTVAFEHPSIQALTDYLERDVLAFAGDEESNGTAAKNEASKAADGVDALTEEEAEDSLLRELEKAGF